MTRLYEAEAWADRSKCLGERGLAIRILGLVFFGVTVADLLVLAGGLEPYFRRPDLDVSARILVITVLAVAALAVFIFPLASRPRIVLTVALGTLLRLAWGLFFFGSYDMTGFLLYNDLLKKGTDLYSGALAAGRIYNYTYAISSIQFAAEKILLAVHPHLQTYGIISTTTALKMPAIAADVLLMILMVLLARRIGFSERAISLALPLYAFNFSQILTSSYQPQFENLALIFVFGALLLESFLPGTFLAALALGLVFGLGVSIKHTVVIFAFAFLVKYRKSLAALLGFTLAAIAPFLILTVPFLLRDPAPVISSLFQTTPSSGSYLGAAVAWYGKAYLPQYGLVGTIVGLSAVGLSILAITWLLRRRSTVDLCFLAAILFLIFTPGIAGQYFTLLYVFLPFRRESIERYWILLVGGLGSLNFLSYWQAVYGSNVQRYSVFGERVVLVLLIVLMLLMLTRFISEEPSLIIATKRLRRTLSSAG